MSTCDARGCETDGAVGWTLVRMFACSNQRNSGASQSLLWSIRGFARLPDGCEVKCGAE